MNVRGLVPAVFALHAAAPAQDRWQRLPEPPIPARYGATMHSVGTHVAVFGGQDVAAGDAEQRVDGAVFDARAGTWTRLPDAPLGERAGTLVVAVTGGILVGGGRDRWEKLHSDAFVLDVGEREWRRLPPWPIRPRQQASVAVDGDTVALFGGHVPTRRRDGGFDVEHFADGVLVDTRTGEAKAIPKGPLSPRVFAAVALRSGKFVVAGGHASTYGGPVRWAPDAAVFDVATGAWTTLDAPPLRPQNSLNLGGHGDTVFAIGNDSRRAFGFVCDLAKGACVAVPGLDALDLGMECTRVFGGAQRSLLFNSGMQLHDDAHQAFWLGSGGLAALSLPADVRPRQAFALTRMADDVVLFGGNHDIALGVADGPPPPPKRLAGPEGDGLHFDLAAGTVARIPPGPLPPRARAALTIADGRLFVLWGQAPGARSAHDLCPDGAAFRLR
ncbi:MAG: hypothetical protein JNK78_01135 [Planctomycetes bacterium]|nr:hypothetical protein [Planctomycetota bacterium]